MPPPPVLRLAHAAMRRYAGVDITTLAANARQAPRFLRDLQEYRRLAADDGFPLELQPILTDFTREAGEAQGHYFHMDLWAARLVCRESPAAHFDIGSRIDGFVSHVLSFMPVTLLDIRPLSSRVRGLTFVRADATDLRDIASDSIESLSSLHAVEHFGLGRYGDAIAPEACFLAMREMARVLKPDGSLYFAVPIGRQRVEFNAHRVFAPRTVLTTFANAGLRLESFAAVSDEGELVEPAEPARFERAHYSCGLFHFMK